MQREYEKFRRGWLISKQKRPWLDEVGLLNEEQSTMLDEGVQRFAIQSQITLSCSAGSAARLDNLKKRIDHFPCHFSPLFPGFLDLYTDLSYSQRSQPNS